MFSAACNEQQIASAHNIEKMRRDRHSENAENVDRGVILISRLIVAMLNLFTHLASLHVKKDVI